MSITLRRIKTHRNANDTINHFYDNDSHCLLVHYSCESFYEIKDGKTPRITSIAVRYLSTGQTKSFSIHKIAELRKISIDDICANYDILEKEMLNDFYRFVNEHKEDSWIHWNMRDINFGFEALQYRATLFGAETCEIKDEKKFDLARLIIDKYGDKYSDHPRLTSILKMNNINPKNWLNGTEEARAFDEKEYVKLHQSTLSKVDTFETILRYSAEGKLKTKAKLTDIYGFSPQGIFELAKDHWFYSLILIILTTLLSKLL